MKILDIFVESEDLDSRITRVMSHFSVDPKYFAEVKAACIQDYDEYDIADITDHDVVEIMDASGISTD